MPIVSAENNFRKGLEALVDQNHVEAAMYFRRAMDIEHQRCIQQPDMRYLSYYGLCRAKAHYKIKEGIHACKRAARMRRRDPEMFLNLGRTYLMARDRTRAYEAFEAGLRLDPMHEVLALEAAKLESRMPKKPSPAARGSFFSRVRSAWNRPVVSSR